MLLLLYYYYYNINKVSVSKVKTYMRYITFYILATDNQTECLTYISIAYANTYISIDFAVNTHRKWEQVSVFLDCYMKNV